MAQDNLISAEISAATLAEIRTAIETIRTKLPFLVNLTMEERQAYAKMGDKTVAFVSKALSYAKENPTLCPPYLNVAEFEKDMQLVEQLDAVLRPLRAVVEGVDDSTMLAGSEAYAAALIFYNSVKMAAKMNVPGTDSIYEDLSARFPGRGTKKDEAEA